MTPEDRTLFIATRGSALALAQANTVLAQCRAAFPQRNFELKIIKTTGDKLQTASLAKEGESLPKGLFTKELEVALLEGQADLAIHSLKDLPTELPVGLELGAVSVRADVRDVLIYRADYKPHLAIEELRAGATVGTSSTRRKAQLLAHRADLKIIDHRGNVLTRIEKLAARPELEAIVLAAAGLARLNFRIAGDGKLSGEGIPSGLLATILEPEIMLPCVGQGALGIEVRAGDEIIAKICGRLNHFPTQHCVTAERAFLAAMGGGCQSPVAAYGEIFGDQVRLRAASFCDGPVRHGEGARLLAEATALGHQLAQQLKS